MTDGVQPFSNGTEFGDWEDSNCNRCKLGTSYDEDKRPYYKCKIQKAIHLAYLGDGKIPQIKAELAGYRNKTFPRRCEQFQQMDNAPADRKPAKTREHQGQLKLV